MKFNKLAIAFCSAVLALWSCQTEKAIYVPDNKNVSFTETNASYTLDGEDIVVPIVRGVADKAASVDIKLVDKLGIYTLKTPTVNFGSGEYTSEVRLSYDINSLMPVVDYAFTLSFDEADMSVVGNNVFNASAMMPLEYEDYGEVTIGYCYFASLMPKKTFTLKKAKFTTDYYMIEGFYGSSPNFEFTVLGDNFEIRTLPKSNKWFTVPLVEMASGAIHPSYGQLTGWIDPDTDYCFVTGAAEDNSLVEGSTLEFDIYWTVSAGYFGWFTEYLYVSKVY